jgi:hypothetical protein
MTAVPRRSADIENDPVVVVIPDGGDGLLDDWLASLRQDGPPTELAVSGAELVAEARREYE